MSEARLWEIDDIPSRCTGAKGELISIVGFFSSLDFFRPSHRGKLFIILELFVTDIFAHSWLTEDKIFTNSFN